MTSQYSVDEHRVAFNMDTITKSDRGRDQLCIGRSEWNIQELAYPFVFAVGSYIGLACESDCS